jgi:hypothetical protein
VKRHALRGARADAGQAAQRVQQVLQRALGHTEGVRTGTSCRESAACQP